MFTDDLRKSILQAAIQGKLSKQLPTDGNAKDLLADIHAERAKLIKQKKIKPAPPLPPIKAEEIPFDIPQNWQWVRLGDITLKIHYGFTASANIVGNVKLLRITDIQNDKVDWEKVPYCNITETQKKEYLLQENDLVIARTGGTVGKTFIVENLSEDAVFASYLIRTVFNENVSVKFVKIFSGSPLYWKQITDKAQGTGQPNVNGKSLSNLTLPLPPLAEQKRIVAKVDALLAEIEPLAEAERELVQLEKEFPRKMKASLLQAAIQGKLSEQLPTDGDAKDLLADIHAERAKLIKQKKIKPAPPLPPIKAEEIPFDIPENWQWVRLGDICILSKGKIISAGKLPHFDAKYLRGQKEKNLVDNGIFVPAGKKIILVDGENSGEIFTAPEDGYLGSTFQTLDISPKIFVDYFQYFMESKKDYYKKNKRGSAIPHLDRNLFFSTLISLPPLAEQERIVARLEELLKEINF